MVGLLHRLMSHGPKPKVLTEDQAARSVVVTNIPLTTAPENILIYFQRQKNGGGEIDHVHIPKKRTAVITFDSSAGFRGTKRLVSVNICSREDNLAGIFVSKVPPGIFVAKVR